MEDQNSFGGSSAASSGNDLEVDAGVKRAKALTASLKNVCVRTQAWITTLKQNGANATACAQAALEGAKDEFGDVSCALPPSFGLVDECWTVPKNKIEEYIFGCISDFSYARGEHFLTGYELGAINRLPAQGIYNCFWVCAFVDWRNPV